MRNNLGILLPVASLPRHHGIGDFGEPSIRFIDWLSENHYAYWQILPLNPLGPGYSPYMSTCSNAFDYRYISLDLLVKEGFDELTPEGDLMANFMMSINQYYSKDLSRKIYLGCL